MATGKTFPEVVDELTRKVETSGAPAAAEAMASTLSDVAAQYMGGDLALSGTKRGAAVITPDERGGAAIVRTGGVYGLADGGRRVVRPALAPRRSALTTPWGPRASVSGSTWAGFGITDRARGDVFEAGRRAFREAVLS